MPNYFVCTYGNFVGREDLLKKSVEKKCYFLHETAHYPRAIDEIRQGDIILLKDRSFIIAWGEATITVSHTGTDGWKHIIHIAKWNQCKPAVHSYGLQWATLIGGKMSLVKMVTPKWALEKLSVVGQIDTLPFIKQDLFELSLADIASWYYDNIDSDKGIFATVPALQRGLVWTAQQNELFWDSIMRKIPVGSILLCPMILSQNRGNTAATHHILDGQQRCNAIAKGFDCKPFEQDKAIVWLDLDPDENELNGTSRRYLIRVSTAAHPWGYKVTDETGKAACLNTAEIRETLKVQKCSGKGTRPKPAEMYPAKAKIPIPLGFLLHSFMQTETEDEFWKIVGEYAENIPFDTIRNLCKNFIEGDATQKSYIYAGIKNAMSYKMIAMNAPETIITEDTDGTQSTIEHLFQRINRQGTRLDGEELVYSTIKSYWPEITDVLDPIAERRMPASRLLVLAIRVALSDKSLYSKISVNQIRKLINGETDRKKIEDYLNNTLKGACENIDGWLRYSEKNKNGLPPVLYTTIANSAPEIYLLLLILEKQETNFEPSFIISLVLLLFFYDFRRRNSRRENIIRDLLASCWENNFSADNIIQNLREQLKQSEKFISPVDLRTQKEQLETSDFSSPDVNEEEWWQCFERFRCNKDLLLYAQTEYLCGEFPDFDPARKDLWLDHNRPWDYDHIVAQNIVASWKKPENHIWLWCIGNFAAIPLEENRSKSDQVNFEYYEEHLQTLLVADSGLLNKFTSESSLEDQKIFRCAVLERFLVIYDKLYRQVEQIMGAGD